LGKSELTAPHHDEDGEHSEELDGNQDYVYLLNGCHALDILSVLAQASAGGGGRVFLSHDPSMRLAGSYAEVLQSWRFKHGQLFLLLS
jgi:hypothetical protein